MNKKIFNLVLAGSLAAFYIILTLPSAQFSSGLVQIRLAETLTIMPVLTSAGIPGVFIGCLFSNFLNPQNLGAIDILAGSLTTLLAAFFSYKLGKPFRQYYILEKEKKASSLPLRKKANRSRIIALLPPVILNSLIVGFYLPFLLKPEAPSLTLILTSMLSILISQAIVVYGVGLPILMALSQNESIKRYIR